MDTRRTSTQTSKKRREEGYVLLKSVIAVILITIFFSAVLAVLSPALSSFARQVRLIDAELAGRNEDVGGFSRGL